MITIYALCEPDTEIVRYVGKAKDLPQRLRTHRWEAKCLRTHKANWLRSLTAPPTVIILENVSEDEWDSAERYWIAEMRRRGFDLTNHALGGQTSPVEGVGHTEETKQKLRDIALSRGARPPSRSGTRASDETRKKLSVLAKARGCKPPPRGGWNKGLKMSAEAVEANRRSHKGIPWSPARRAAQERRRLAVVGG